MGKRIAAVITGLVVVAAGLGAPPARSEASTVTPEQEATWSGGPFLVPTPLPHGVICPLGRADPTCEHREIVVEPGDKPVLEVVVWGEGDADLDIVVFDAGGERVATAASAEPVEVLRMAAAPGHFTVSVASYWAPVAEEAGRFDATARLSTGGEPRADVPCSGAVPDVPLAPDGALRLSVLSLLDGISLERAQAIVDRARTTWDDAGIELEVGFDDTFEARATGAGWDHQGGWREQAGASTMFEDARNHVGGAVPEGYDAVVVMTDKDLQEYGADFMGVASCLGALGNPEAAFALGEAWADEWGNALVQEDDLAAIIWSHEIGHLANAPHHYGECTYGIGRHDAGDGSHVGADTCSLMLYLGAAGPNKVSTSSLYFSHLNRAVVRAHVAHHAG